MSLIDKLASIKQYRDEIREAVEAKGGNLPEGSHMSEYAGAIKGISGGGEPVYGEGIIKLMEFKDGKVTLNTITDHILELPAEPHKIGENILQTDKTITQLTNTEYTTEIGYNAFQQSAITGDMSFPNVTTLVSTNISDGSHFMNTTITSIHLPQVEYLPHQTLRACNSLKTINIPNVKKINNNAFGFSQKVETIVLGETIPTIEGGTSFQYFLAGSYSPDCQFQVPPHMVDAYKEDTFWSQYADRIIPYPEEV